MDNFTQILTNIADGLCGYPLFIILIGGGLWLFVRSRFLSLRKLPHAISLLRQSETRSKGAQISSLQALMSAVAATIGLGNIAGVAIAIAMGGPGAVFWMWVSALIGMSTKYHEGVLAVKHRATNPDGTTAGGTMVIIDRALPHRWRPLALMFAVAGMFGTLCIMNANQLTEATLATFNIADTSLWRLAIGVAIAAIVAMVVLGGIRRIASVASLMVPVMVGAYFLMVAWIIGTHLTDVPAAFATIVSSAFSLEAGWGALAGIAIIGARRAALVNDAGVGTATIMHSTSSNREPVREGLVAMLGPIIDSGFVCTLTALAIILGSTPDMLASGRGLSIATDVFSHNVPGGGFVLMLIVACFGLSSMFSYSFYGSSCAHYLGGRRARRAYTYFFIGSLVVFAVLPLGATVALCDLFYALMVIPTMATLLRLRGDVATESRRYFSARQQNKPTAETTQTISI